MGLGLRGGGGRRRRGAGRSAPGVGWRGRRGETERGRGTWRAEWGEGRWRGGPPGASNPALSSRKSELAVGTECGVGGKRPVRRRGSPIPPRTPFVSPPKPVGAGSADAAGGRFLSPPRAGSARGRGRAGSSPERRARLRHLPSRPPNLASDGAFASRGQGPKSTTRGHASPCAASSHTGSTVPSGTPAAWTRRGRAPSRDPRVAGAQGLRRCRGGPGRGPE